jgi:6,7-dimethyl-8-ribityllumazine synthase
VTSKLKNLSDYNKRSLLPAKDMMIGLVVSEWNQEITRALLKGAEKTLQECGVKKSNIISKFVPGSFELPLGAQLLIENTEVDAVICLGCVIQGETRHFEFICQAVAQGINMVALEYSVPVVFGVLTTDNLKQAKERSGGKHGNKGVEAAVTAIKMVQLANELYKEDV